ncbi:MAG: rhodanese-like domain-containing protein [Deltaproteobacteria bacterium]|nr:rhodanese-like domain-containing protein [Deltaproteobacteria bacterium]
MIRRLVGGDLAWAAFILGLAVLFGLGQHWTLVRVSFKGELTSYLDKERAARREAKFQGVKTISLAQTYEIFQQGGALFVDARKPEEYAELHISGAIHLDPWKLDMEGPRGLEGVEKTRPIVVYCSQVQCDASLKVAEKLQSLGFSEVAAFLAGFNAWDQAGYPVDTSK